MSSTGRSDGVRRELDAYDTPAWCVQALMDDVSFLFSVGAQFESLPDHGWVDPCGGAGAIAKAVTGWYDARDLPVEQRHVWPRHHVHCIDIDPRGEAVVQGDYFGDWEHWPVDLVLTNPPYSLAEQFIRRAADHARSHAWLLRLNFLAAQKRLPLWADLGTPDVYVLPKRPSFTGAGTDSCEYAWFVWPAGPKRSAGSVRVLELPARRGTLL